MPNYRKRQQSESDSEANEQEDGKVDVQDLKEIQKLKRPRHGFSATEWLTKRPTGSAKESSDTQTSSSVGGSLKVGLNVYSSESDSRNSDGKRGDGEANGGVPAFALATNRCDEDRRMQMFIEEELARRKAAQQKASQGDTQSAQGDAPIGRLVSADDIDKQVLTQVPEHLKRSTMRKQEDTISSTMLSGIPEVDLGVAAKIRNIEQTEAEKQRMLRERAARMRERGMPLSAAVKLTDARALERALAFQDPEAVSDFVPNNVAVNFVQHNRYGIVDDTRKQSANDAKAARRDNEPRNAAVAETSRFRVGDFERLRATGTDSARRATPSASNAAEPQVVVTLGSLHDNPGAELLEKTVTEKSVDKLANGVPIGERATDNMAYDRFTNHFRNNFRRY